MSVKNLYNQFYTQYDTIRAKMLQGKMLIKVNYPSTVSTSSHFSKSKPLYITKRQWSVVFLDF